MQITANKEATTNMWNRRVHFPKGNFAIRCISEEYKLSSNDNPMLVYSFEIVNAEPQKIGDTTYEFDGVTFPTFQVIGVKEDSEWNMEKTQNCVNFFNGAMLEKFGVPQPDGGLNVENPQLPLLLGKCAWALLYAEEQKQYKEPTPEQKAQRKPGDVIKDPITGKDVISYQIKIGEVYGPYTETVARPF